MTAGSDVHRTALLYGGMAFAHKLTGIADYITAVKERRECLLLDGNESM